MRHHNCNSMNNLCYHNFLPLNKLDAIDVSINICFECLCNILNKLYIKSEQKSVIYVLHFVQMFIMSLSLVTLVSITSTLSILKCNKRKFQSGSDEFALCVSVFKTRTVYPEYSVLLYTAAGVMNLIYTGVNMILAYSFERKKMHIFLP